MNTANGLITNEPSALQYSSSYSVPQIMDLNVAYEGDDSDIRRDMGSGTGTGTGGYVEEIDHQLSSPGDQNLSYKRKLPNEASGQLHLSGNLSHNQQVENSDCHDIPAPDSSSRSSSMYTPSNILPNPSQSETNQVTPELGFGMVGAESYMYGNSIVAGNTEGLHRNVRPRREENQQVLLPASMPLSGTLSTNSHIQLPPIISQLNHYTNFTENIASASQNGSSVGVQPSAPLGFPLYNIDEGSQNGSGAGVQLSPAHLGVPSYNIDEGYAGRWSDMVYQSVTTSADFNFGWQTSNHSLNPRASIAARDVNAAENGDPRANELFPRPGALTTRTETYNTAVPPIPLEVLPIVDAESRARLMLEVRNALELLQRLQAFQNEDVRIIDGPEFYGESEEEEYDMHEDMRLDIDNMSYEELLALEEQIGDVSTGLSEEAILAGLTRDIHWSIPIGPLVDEEPCSICQDEFVNGQEIGKLDCGHGFHFDCIKQWLMQKNLCPMCKKIGLTN